jgi:hypothetical protein
MLCGSCVIADMQSTNCRPNRATTAKTTNSLLLIMLVRLYVTWTPESMKGYTDRLERTLERDNSVTHTLRSHITKIYSCAQGSCPLRCQTCVKTVSCLAAGLSVRAKADAPSYWKKQKWEEAIDSLESSRASCEAGASSHDYSQTSRCPMLRCIAKNQILSHWRHP